MARSSMRKSIFAFLLAGACAGSPSSQPDGGATSTDTGTSSSSALYPLAMGDHWTYAIAAVGTGAVCAAGTHAQDVVSTNAVGGRAAFQMTSFCTGVAGTNSYATSAGDEIDFYYQGTWAKLVEPMLVDGQAWTYFNTSYHWRRDTTVTVPAATYHDCWTAVQNVSYTAYLTYCRGAGLVRSYSADLGGNGWDAQLASVTLTK
jgi:hypothetical protein